MQRTIEKNRPVFQEENKEPKAKKLELKDIENFYIQKKDGKYLYGLEYERLSLDKNTLENAQYEKLSKIIEHFSSILSWEIVYDKNTIIGAKAPDGTSISLEPGCQLEISVAPKENIVDIDVEASKIIELLDKIAKIYDVIFIGYGITPKSALDKISLLEKRRYQIMNEYLPYCTFGEFCPKMMRQTAGIQVNIDYKNNSDAYYKLKFFNLIMPFVTGLCANSPIENDCLTKNKTNRANAWIYTGSARCNFFYKDIFNKFFNKKNNVFKNYINEILNVPMVYIERDDKYIEIKGKINFKQFMKEGYEGYSAVFDDYILHQSLCFPDVRLKNYIEIRNHDSSSLKNALALCALYKGLCRADIKDLINKFSYLKLKDIEKYNKTVIESGLDFNINSKTDGWHVALNLLNIARNNLSSKERIYLEPLFNIIKSRKTQADILIDYGIKNAKELVDFLCE